jgi:hypothetical protein
MKKPDIIHFHKLDEDKKYMLLLIISSDKLNNAANVQLSFRQGMNNWRVNDKAYRMTYTFNVYHYNENPDNFTLSDKLLYRRLLANEIPTKELSDLFEKFWPGYIEIMRKRLVEK